jgi:uncharacterized protein YndB with AHSA1/START domain
MLGKLILLILTFVAALAAQTGPNDRPLPDGTSKVGAVTVTVTRAAQKMLEFKVDVPAPLDAVWESMTTSAGLITWLTPDAEVDLRPGGNWLAKFPGAPPGGGKIENFTPKTRIAIRAMAPDQFPTVRREGTDAVFEMASLDPQTTRVTLTQTDWKDGEEWDHAFDYLAKGNAMLLNGLRQRFVKGPVDWKALMAQPGH